MSGGIQGRGLALAGQELAAALVLAATASGLVWGWTRAIDEAARTAGIVAIVVVAATGALLRLLRAPVAVVSLAQIAALGAAAFAYAQRPGLELGPGVIASQLVQYADALARATVFPVAAHPAAELAACLVCGALVLVADTTAIGGGVVVGALVPLVALAVAPFHVPGSAGLDAAGLVILIVGFALLCLLLRPWPRAGRDKLVAALVAAGLAATSLGATTVLAPRWAPHPPPRPGPIQMTDLSLSLKREIQRGSNTPALTYRTDDGRPAYLRLYALPNFGADGWHLSDTDVRTGTPPEPAVRDGVHRTTHVQITGFASEWLPAPYSAVSTSTHDTFGYLPETNALLALSGDRTRATAGLSYDVTSVASQPDRAALLAARGGIPEGASSVGVPADVPDSIRKLAGSLTSHATTDGAKAVALADYLARPEFTYSLDAAPDSGYDVLETFLLKEHRGFCVQYAASLAAMARTVGIPSRVAVGFAPGKAEGDGWRVTMHDMHAWTELYLADYGWVAFDPTPGIGRAASSANPTAQPTPEPSRPSATPTSTPTSAKPTQATPPSSTTPTPTPQSRQQRDEAHGFDAGDVARALALLLVVCAVAIGPRWVRSRQRRRRLAPDATRSGAETALAAWREVQALTLDYGRPWPAGSPRYAAQDLAGVLAGKDANRADTTGLQTLALASEAALYGASAHAPKTRDWAPVVTAVEAELARGVSRGRRWRARWWPASLWTRP